MRTRVLFLIAGALVVITTTASYAHVDINWPPMRNGNQKIGPCENTDAKTPVTLRGGSTLTIRITETIQHPGHFRVLFDRDTSNGEDFPLHQACDEELSPGELPVDTTILTDRLLPAPGKHCADFDSPATRTPVNNAEYSFDVTLPDIECENCAIQVVQVMTDKAEVWSNQGGSGLYFRCADVRLSDTDVVDEDPGTGSEDHDEDEDTLPTNANAGGCSAAQQSSLALVMLFLGISLATCRTQKRTSRRTSTKH